MEANMKRWWNEVAKLLRSGAAGLFATGVDLLVLCALTSGFHLGPRVASVPALLAGGVANFFANRHFAFRAARGSLARQAALYTIVEAAALALNGLLYDVALRAMPAAAPLYFVVRIVTSHVVFLGFSYPLWRRIFRAAPARAARLG
jgi:putative flippase GtrA